MKPDDSSFSIGLDPTLLGVYEALVMAREFAEDLDEGETWRACDFAEELRALIRSILTTWNETQPRQNLVLIGDNRHVLLLADAMDALNASGDCAAGIRHALAILERR